MRSSGGGVVAVGGGDEQAARASTSVPRSRATGLAYRRSTPRATLGAEKAFASAPPSGFEPETFGLGSPGKTEACSGESSEETDRHGVSSPASP